MPVNAETLDNTLSSENQAPNQRLNLCVDATTGALVLDADKAASKALPAVCALIVRRPSECVLTAHRTFPRHGLDSGWGTGLATCSYRQLVSKICESKGCSCWQAGNMKQVQPVRDKLSKAATQQTMGKAVFTA